MEQYEFLAHWALSAAAMLVAFTGRKGLGNVIAGAAIASAFVVISF